MIRLRIIGVRLDSRALVSGSQLGVEERVIVFPVVRN